MATQPPPRAGGRQRKAPIAPASTGVAPVPPPAALPSGPVGEAVGRAPSRKGVAPAVVNYRERPEDAVVPGRKVTIRQQVPEFHQVEAAVLVTINDATRRNPQRGIEISDLERAIVAAYGRPVHSIVNRLADLLLIGAPVMDSAGKPHRRLLVTTEQGQAIAEMYEMGTIQPIAEKGMAGVPIVKLPGDDDPTPPKVERNTQPGPDSPGPARGVSRSTFVTPAPVPAPTVN